jgi:hypothetical protein
VLPFLVAAPWLALIPALAFALLARGRRSGMVAAGAWLCYAAYEFAMQRRWLCTGECNIRVDLLLLHPLLLLGSAVAIVALLRTPKGRSA